MSNMKEDIAQYLTDLFYKLTALIIRTIFLFYGPIETRGKENVPAEGGIIIAANHISHLDPPLIGSVSPRRITFMAKRSLFKVPVLGFLISFFSFPVDRDKPLPSTIKDTVRRLRRGEVIAMFPEGTRSKSGELREAKRGVGVVASLSKVPVVPTLVVGSDKSLPVDARWLKKAKITVVFGKPIYYTSSGEETGRRNQNIQEEISNRIMAAIKELKDDFVSNRNQ